MTIDTFSKLLIETALSQLTEKSKCNKSGAGTACPTHGDADCNSSKQNRAEEVGTTYEFVMEDGETIIMEKIKMDGVDDNGSKTCWKGYKKAGTKNKGGKEVNNCVKAGYEPEGDTIEEKNGLYANIHAKRKRGGSPAKPGSEDYPAKDAFAKSAKTAKKEGFEGSEKDDDEDKKLAKKNKMSLKDWEKSDADKKHDMKKEAKDMPGGQEKIDANKNGKVDAHDFALLRARKGKKTVKEMWEIAEAAMEGKKKIEIEIMPDVDTPNDPEPPMGKKAKMKKEEVELEEKKLSDAEAAKKEKFVKGMKKKFGKMQSKYGDKAQSVMYGTATKMAKTSK